MGSKNNLRVVSALILGAVAGTAIGLLFAPSGGKKLRRSINNRVNDFTENLKSGTRREDAEEKVRQDLS